MGSTIQVLLAMRDGTCYSDPDVSALLSGPDLRGERSLFLSPPRPRLVRPRADPPLPRDLCALCRLCSNSASSSSSPAYSGNSPRNISARLRKISVMTEMSWAVNADRPVYPCIPFQEDSMIHIRDCSTACCIRDLAPGVIVGA